MQPLRIDERPIIFKNFAGAEQTYNAAGDRNFSVLFEDLDEAGTLITLGWNLRPLKDEEGEIYAYHLPVKLNYKSRRPPQVYKVTLSDRKSVSLVENVVEILDALPIEYADLMLNPYEWNVRGETGVKAYLQTGYFVIEESELDMKWAEFLGGDDD